MDEEHARRLRASIAEAMHGRAEFGQLTRRTRPDNGAELWVETKGRVLKDDGGNVLCLRGVTLDVTERVRHEEERRATDRRKDEFLAMLAHELRNPLAPIRTAAQLLGLAPGDAAKVREAAAIIERQVGHMTNLVDDLLDVSRVNRGLVQLELEVVDLKSVVANAIEQVRPLIESRGHELTSITTSAAAMVLGDRVRLVQVLANLLTNAAKYTAPGGRIEVRVAAQSGTALMSVSDNGNGIEPSLVPHLFELFIQGSRTPDRTQGGLGLGLALVRSIMELHGGRVDVASAGPGHGSTFTIALPLTQSQIDASPRVAAKPVHGPVTRALRILIVDDNVDAARLLATMLEGDGHEVRLEQDSTLALEAALARPPDVFILDIGLPGMDGNELARRLRAHPATAPALLVALTGYGQPQDIARSRAAGFDHHLVKPTGIGEVCALLEAAAGA